MLLLTVVAGSSIDIQSISTQELAIALASSLASFKTVVQCQPGRVALHKF